jgi:hypothetical protein
VDNTGSSFLLVRAYVPADVIQMVMFCSMAKLCNEYARILSSYFLLVKDIGVFCLVNSIIAWFFGSLSTNNEGRPPYGILIIFDG